MKNLIAGTKTSTLAISNQRWRCCYVALAESQNLNLMAQPYFPYAESENIRHVTQSYFPQPDPLMPKLKRDPRNLKMRSQETYLTYLQ
ncbi:hypothetical protein L195_g048946, partial [Trifolium pratense]